MAVKAKDPNLYSRERRRVMVVVRAEEAQCWLCGLFVDQSLPSGHRYSSTVDEIIPRSHGGSAVDRANLHHAHLTCNSSRGNRPPRPRPSLTSRRW